MGAAGRSYLRKPFPLFESPVVGTARAAGRWARRSGSAHLSRYPIDRAMTALRADGVEIPSNPNPK